ncbi:Peroxisome membrane protein Pex16 [Gracilaria domingensis]|nr:Peroxisome membrane protein Pex16 [Gracilaria domingensis]
MSASVSKVRFLLQSADDSLRTSLLANNRLLAIAADALQSIALLTPSANAELRAQIAATFVSLLTIYRDYPSAPFSKSRRRKLLALNVISAVQLLVEMVAKRCDTASKSPSRAQLNSISILEAAKALLRLSLLSSPNENQMRVLTAADQQLPETPAPPSCTCGMQSVPGNEKVAVEKGSRTNRMIIKPRKDQKRQRSISRQVIAGLEPVPSALQEHRPTSDPLLDALFTIAYERRANWVVRMFMPQTKCEACSSTPPRRPTLSQTMEGIQHAFNALTPTELAAEVAYVVRPFIHISLIRRFGWRSWKAWCAALLLDVASRSAMAAPASPSELEERRRRMAQLVLYLGRSPLFDLILRRVIKKFTTPLRKVPLVGGISSSAIEWITLLQQYWFYLSAS